jgi:hypothetical protein
VPHYFLLHDSHFFEERILATFTLSWQSRSFTAVAEMVPLIRPGIASFTDKFRMGTDETVLEQVARGLQFDRDIWEMALGEALFFGAREAPESPISFASLRYLLGAQPEPDPLVGRSEWLWIDRAVLGSRTLRFGRASYRTQNAGWNSPQQVSLLAGEARSVDPAPWHASQLEKFDVTLDDEDRSDELALALQALQQIRSIYDRATEFGHVVVCEAIN